MAPERAGEKVEKVPDEYLMFEEVIVEVSGFFTTHHWFQTEGGTRVELVFPAFAGYGVVQTSGDRELVMQKTHWLGSGHEFVDGDSVRATADKTRLLSRDWTIKFDGERFFLVPEGLLKQGWFLVDESGTRLLEIRPRGAFRQGAHITVCGVVNSQLAIFAYYLVQVRQQEDAAVVAAGAS
jgi:hypothetical protein